jgi:hypothetical protein
MSDQVPVLLVIFNRPEKTRKVIDALRKVKPSRIFIAGDGPRPNRPEDIEHCRLARMAATGIDWPCDVKTRFLDENVGCGRGVSSAITWFFEHVESGIILEDDCIPHPHFFPFCAELFKRYAQDQRVMGINGFVPYPVRSHQYDYHFSRRFRCSGWGTWRRAWKLFSYECEGISEVEFLEMTKAYYPHYFSRSPWIARYKKFKNGSLKTWAFRFEISQFAQNGLFIVPEKNMITNIGFDSEATHTVLHDPCYSNIKTKSLSFPLRHPDFVFADNRQEKKFESLLFKKLPLKSKCAWHLKNMLGTVLDFYESLL